MQLLKYVCGTESTNYLQPQGTLVRATYLGIAKLCNDKYKDEYKHKHKDKDKRNLAVPKRLS